VWTIWLLAHVMDIINNDSALVLLCLSRVRYQTISHKTRELECDCIKEQYFKQLSRTNRIRITR
jgi:hypothetical protein